MFPISFSVRVPVSLAAAAGAVFMAAVAWAQPPAPTPAAPPALSAADRALMVQALRDTEEAAATGAEDAQLKAAVVRHAQRELGQRLRPSAVDRMWAVQPPRRDVAAELAAAQAGGRLGSWLAALSPTNRQYRLLQAAERRYEAMVAAGGWTSLPGKAKLKEGDRSAEVEALRVRLSAEGYGQSTAPELDRFDPALTAALAAFQRRHNLTDDGVLGPETRTALNVPAQARLDQIRANLERWRWMPRNLPAERMMVDIGGQRAALFQGGRPILRMKIVVGDPKHHTPMFISKINAVVFNPPWLVPTSIASKEIWPKVRRDPGYLARGDYIVSSGRLIQQPGPKNSLGQLKFDLPSPFGVYLHDTPSKGAFGKRNRALSHGCMRLEKPRDLAVILLARQGWSEADVDQAIAAGATRRVDLKTTVPLYVSYWTVVADEAGEIDFKSDVYGWDRKLAAALGPEPVRRAALPRTGTDCADPRR
ncbi:L,D-transpeptidase family protein [Phenylobacterium soli]|nr:L,D-transpeptidase family protein [Phenylobacterium soli]